MKKNKHRVLALLLFTFAFFVVHDYVVQGVDYTIAYELGYKDFDKTDMQNKLHESIHNIFSFNLQETPMKEAKLLYTAPSSILFSLSTNINPVPQRPPLL